MQNAHIFQNQMKKVQRTYIDLTGIVLQCKKNAGKRSI